VSSWFNSSSLKSSPDFRISSKCCHTYFSPLSPYSMTLFPKK
jgi:hypothetical protein